MEEFALRSRLLELETKVSGLESDAARYRALLRARNDLIVELDERGLISAVSPALLERSGYSASECLGRSTFAFTTAECAQRLRAQSPTLFDWAARRHPFEILMLCKNGAELWLEGNIYAYSTDGGVSGMFCLYRDITESKVLEGENRRMGEGAVVALALSGVEAFEFDFVEGLVWQSPGYGELFGLGENDARYFGENGWLGRVSSPDIALVADRVELARKQGGDAPSVVVRVQRANAEIRYIKVDDHYEFNSDQSLSRILVSARDVTSEQREKISLQACSELATPPVTNATTQELEHTQHRLEMALQIGEIGVAEWSRAKGWFGISDGALVEYSPDGVVRIDSSARFVSANPAVVALIGVPVEEIIGRTPEQLPISPERALEFRRRIELFFGTGQGDEFELQFKKLPNSPWLLVRYVPELGPDGKPKHMLVFLRDVSQLKSAEQLALATARQMGQILETAEEGILVADANNVIVFNNPKLEQIFGYAPNELKGQHESLLQLADSEKQWQQRSQERIAGLSESYSHHFRRKDGSLVLCWVNAKPLQDEHGKFSGTLAMLTDVTDVERSERELRKGIEWLEFSMESAQIAGMDFDVESGHSRTTVLFREWFGIPEDGEGSPLLNWTQRVHHEDRARIQMQIQSILERGSSARIDFRLIDSAGELHWLYGVLVTVCNVVGPVARVVFTVLDITPRRKLEAEREALQNQIARAQKEESLGNLAAGFAHDLNNLLTTAFGHIDLARLLIPEPDADNSLQHVVESLTQMSRLSEQLLAYSGKTPVNSKTVDFNELLLKVQSIMAVSVNKKANFALNLTQEQLVLHAAESQLQQVALNLVVNASEALEGRTGDIEISTTKVSRVSLAAATQLQIEPNFVYLAKLSVRDSGVGIAEHTQARLFEPFFSTKGQGRGLGMSVVAGIVRAHRGAIEVVSSLDSGTVVSVYLPLESSSQITAFAPLKTTQFVAAEAPQVRLESPVSTGLILVVDDEPTLRNLICRTLNAQGFETISAANGDEALVLIAARPEIALVLLDLTMPQRDGLEVYAEILAFYPKLAVMLMSGYNEQSVASRLGPDAPVPAFLHKPFRSTELLSMVRKTLAGS